MASIVTCLLALTWLYGCALGTNAYMTPNFMLTPVSPQPGGQAWGKACTPSHAEKLSKKRLWFTPKKVNGWVTTSGIGCAQVRPPHNHSGQQHGNSAKPTTSHRRKLEQAVQCLKGVTTVHKLR